LYREINSALETAGRSDPRIHDVTLDQVVREMLVRESDNQRKRQRSEAGTNLKNSPAFMRMYTAAEADCMNAGVVHNALEQTLKLRARLFRALRRGGEYGTELSDLYKGIERLKELATAAALPNQTEAAEPFDWNAISTLAHESRGNTAEFLKLVVEKKSDIAIADLASLFQWGKPYDHAWDGLRKRVNNAFDRHALPYRLGRGNNQARIRRVQVASEKDGKAPEKDGKAREKDGKGIEKRRISTGAGRKAPEKDGKGS
jgi:hypothetical protein